MIVTSFSIKLYLDVLLSQEDFDDDREVRMKREEEKVFRLVIISFSFCSDEIHQMIIDSSFNTFLIVNQRNWRSSKKKYKFFFFVDPHFYMCTCRESKTHDWTFIE